MIINNNCLPIKSNENIYTLFIESNDLKKKIWNGVASRSLSYSKEKKKKTGKKKDCVLDANQFCNISRLSIWGDKRDRCY